MVLVDSLPYSHLNEGSTYIAGVWNLSFLLLYSKEPPITSCCKGVVYKCMTVTGKTILQGQGWCAQLIFITLIANFAEKSPSENSHGVLGD